MKTATDMDYIITRSSRKSVCIIVKKDNTIEVKAPLKMRQADIENFVSSKRDRIEKILESNKAFLSEFGYGSSFPFFGKDITLAPAETSHAVLRDNNLYIPDGLSKEEICNQVTEFYRKRAYEYLPDRVKLMSERTGLNYSSLMINRAKTHWGSCTCDRLHLSCFLMSADEKEIDYVIIHELAHTVHHNHSNAFWALVQRHCPDCLQLRKNLKITAKKLNFLF